ncbi:MAG TPA: D-glucuronyl C5-epimerase family protein [candidate division Zixibacteria bacterium]|nr:D-glucuronyl C5-epimerase family protein [candidate division Zixibacteria bacterium]
MTLNTNTLKIPAVVCLALLLLILSCHSDHKAKGRDDRPIEYPDSCVQFQFELVNLPWDSLPYTDAGLNLLPDTAGPRDSSGILLFEWHDTLYYHPVMMCHRALAYIDLFHDHGDSAFLTTARRYVDCLVTQGIHIDSALYFPYQFDYRVHGRDDALITKPFFSGMAQGQALSALCRLYSLTSDERYRQLADEVFQTMLRPRGEYTPWTVFYDTPGCFWIEEYVTEPIPSMTLNGFIFGIYGLYDYWQMTGNADADRLIQEAISTVRNYIPSYRRPGNPSFYGLTFHHYDANYHKLHIRQLRQLTRFTGDPFFESWADTLESDYRE